MKRSELINIGRMQRLSFCWKNDTDDGFLITMVNMDDEARQLIADRLPPIIEAIRKDPSQGINRVEQFARDYNANGRKAPDDGMLPVIAMIIIAMVRLKLMPNDEYNGILAVYGPDSLTE